MQLQGENLWGKYVRPAVRLLLLLLFLLCTISQDHLFPQLSTHLSEAVPTNFPRR
jgi:hypothetical protein